jgi:hypothetical protein
MTKAKDPHFQTAQGEPKRDRWGRYVLPDPETGKERSWTRATTVSGILSDRYNLELWARRMVALGLAKRPDLLALVQSGVRLAGTPNGKRTLNRVVDQALEAGNSEQRANIGTAIHAATESMDLGLPWELPVPYDRDVEKYGAEMDKRKFLVLEDDSGPWVERIVLCPKLEIAGTLDRVFVTPIHDLPVIADIKTGSTVHFSELEHAIQQSIYANATHYWDPTTEALAPMPAVDKDHALIIHVPAGTGRCEVHELDIVRGWKAAMIAAEVKHEWRNAKDLSRTLER